ncbi:hypothetical protein BOTBODRAFT_507300 [Botryobasidium botryosum FD-172 SS1]|uniref:F-box domain-containing protein n=1 Tax=Botryobasidium botryosum (strain FD-172 SS1) TaxID=930990 RepID=A0A067M2F4_BOTB1|nr:hypothetical protein BOTBODRAFT_507300 [Botryobasidium botryosum FD-172 SS1]
MLLNSAGRASGCGLPKEPETPVSDARAEQDPSGAEGQCIEITPIHRLPTEILSLIFDVVAMSGSVVRYWRTPMPFIIAGVSRQSREIALSTPMLWAYSDYNLKSRVHVDLFLIRSKAVYHVGSRKGGVYFSRHFFSTPVASNHSMLFLFLSSRCHPLTYRRRCWSDSAATAHTTTLYATTQYSRGVLHAFEISSCQHFLCPWRHPYTPAL